MKIDLKTTLKMTLKLIIQILCKKPPFLTTRKIEKERKRNEKRNARSLCKIGTEQERVPQIQQRNEEGTRSSKI